MKRVPLTLIALAGLIVCSTNLAFARQDPNAGETKAHRDARMHWWREARFGMFIHWGLYAEPAGEYNGKRTDSIGEWIMHDLKIPVADYAELAKKFDPEQFNADQWVSIAKSAGMKYIVMTAKHHEGFAMFHTKVDGYNIYDATPFKRDPIAEMAAACRKQGIKFGVYYSQAQDWHHAGGAAYGGHWDTAQDGDLHEYVKKIAAPQVDELLSKYHPAVLWWDTSVGMSPEDIKELTASFSKDPGLIANNRLGNGVPGDTETPEQYIPPKGYPGKDWETCMTINDTWGYKSFDKNFKSTETLLRNLIDIASKGGNYLLNVGPEPTGLIPAPEVERLKDVGKWLKTNGASIYATSPSPYQRLSFDGRATVKGKSLYLNVFNWPEGGLVLNGLQTPVLSAKSVATGQKLSVQKGPDGALTIEKPTQVDPISTAIVLNLSGPPVVVEPEFQLTPMANGDIQLKATDAKTEGSSIQVEGENVGYWTNEADSVSWKVTVPEANAGKYNAHLNYSCEPGTEGATYVLDVDGVASDVTGKVAKTGSWGDYASIDLEGVLTLPTGSHVVKVHVLAKPGFAVMNLKNILLTPVK
ncbi:MAG: alpha-L-fucosidase [Fimbriimonas sp.]|nr:alpha-L-fucosidase [Fimbriimonas sp.]